MNDAPDIQLEAWQECVQFLKDESIQIPHLSERLLVDTVNGLDVIDDQLRYKSKQGLVSRCLGVFGSNRRREIIIQQTQQQAMHGLLYWIEELTHNASITCEALSQTRVRLEATRRDLLYVARHSIRNRDLIEANTERISYIEQRLNMEIETRLESLEIDNEINKKCTAWQAGNLYANYPALIQAAYVIDDLIRGARGHRICEEHREYLYNAVVVGLKSMGFEPGAPLSLDDWLRGASIDEPERQQVAVWLLCHRRKALLHNAIGESAELGKPAMWVCEKISNGQLLPYYKPSGLVRELRREAASALEN
ncbi:MAG: hypothetical protein GXY07_14730 [Candidatus Hydrogenedentes bacterium]|nr:hypothetical protein [Candidatus Hydrogenedentota bacterium]